MYNRLRQMAFFVFAKVDKGRLSSKDERFWNEKCCRSFFLYYIKQIDSMLPCVCRASIFWSPLPDLLLNRRTATWNLFVKYFLKRFSLQLQPLRGASCYHSVRMQAVHFQIVVRDLFLILAPLMSLSLILVAWFIWRIRIWWRGEV